MRDEPGDSGDVLADLLDVARSVAAQAADLLVRGRPADLGVAATKSSPTDVVTEMDTASERLIRDGLRAARPGDAVLGEEGGASGGTSGVRWVIDPLDGTVNYLYGYPSWCVSVAAEVDGEPAVGVVVVPPTGETFHAVRGRGAFRNDQPIRTRAAAPLARALVATGFGYATERRRSQGAVAAALLPQVRDLRRGGSAAVDLCSVACGRVDGYYERGVQAWDIAAGTVIAREAGALVGGLHGTAPGPELTVAAPPGLFEPLHDVLAGLDAASG